MKPKFICSLLILTLAAACGRSSARQNQQQYETVSEGSASGVTSTIHGPGETLPPITGTNADHTTAFAFDPNAPPSTSSTMPATTQPPGTIVGTLPPPVTRTTPPPVTAPRPQPVPQEPPPQQQRPVTPQPTPPPTDTTETEPPEPPPTDTGEQEPEPEPEPPPPTNTDTSATSTQPPPPPPPIFTSP